MKYLLEGEESARLIFRLVQKNDFDWWLRFASNPESIKYFGFDIKLTPLEITKLWFDKVFERYQNNIGGLNVIVEKATGLPVGQCGLLIQEVDNISELEIGYSLCPEFWGRGFATEAAKKCRDFCFKNNFAESIISIVHRENIRSQNVALRNGMKFEKKTEFKNMPVNIYRI